ncbi:TerD family protein [Leucothrix arctica]|uniref:Tellurium resistance protein n=1 Tax=Leucothrix arctica TaxID=1481894 RepID=A0A317CEM5_9GAMM|nr:TerD family protein [Leucothrix arctica]PWQ94760.1 tellurium resistance protein [Leucothrix arctica]
MVTEIQKGGNCALECSSGTILIKHPASTAIDINLTAFLLDDSGKVKNENDMVFFNQPSDPAKIAQFKLPVDAQGITIHQIDFSLNTSTDITKIAITLTEDNGIGFTDLNLTAEIHCNGNVTLLTPQEFSSEKGIIVAEIYSRNGQIKVRSVWQGFATGLAGLCERYGVEVDDKPEPKQVEKVSSNISLEKVSGKIDLSKGKKAILIEKTPVITASISWDSNTDYDVYALVYLNNGEQVDVAMFGADGIPSLQSYDKGVVHHCGDVGNVKKGLFQRKNNTCKEEIKIRLNDTIKAVVPVAYSAQSNGTGSFHKYNVSMLIDNHQGTEVNIPAENANKDNNIYTCVPGVITNTPDGVVIKALEYYSKPGSENRPKLKMGSDGIVDVLMDEGAKNDYK